jgi:hypothetical protein
MRQGSTHLPAPSIRIQRYPRRVEDRHARLHGEEEAVGEGESYDVKLPLDLARCSMEFCLSKKCVCTGPRT